MSKSARRLWLVTPLLVAWLSSGPVLANPTDQQYIINKLQFVYVPNAAAPATQSVIDPAKVINDDSFYPNASFDIFRDIIKAFVGGVAVNRPGFTTADRDGLQAVLARTLKVTDAKIQVVLYNDLTTPAANRVWPHAFTSGTEPDSPPRSTAAFGGSLHLGMWHFKNNTQFAKFFTILATCCHELLHTQDVSSGRFGEFFDSTSHPGVFYHYGADGTHYFTEAIPDMAMTYKEGVANFVGMCFATDGVNAPATWFLDNDLMLIEKPPVGAGPLPSQVYDYNSLDATKMVAVTQPNMGGWHLNDLPATVLARNEWIHTLILFELASTISTDVTLTAPGFNNIMNSFQSMNGNTLQVSTSAWAMLINQLSNDLLPAGMSRSAVAPATTSAPRKYMLPVAFVDYFTRFKSTDEANFRTMLEDSPQIQTWSTAYFGGNPSTRSIVRTAVTDWETAHPLAATATDADKAARLRQIAKVIAQSLGV